MFKVLNVAFKNVIISLLNHFSKPWEPPGCKMGYLGIAHIACFIYSSGYTCKKQEDE